MHCIARKRDAWSSNYLVLTMFRTARTVYFEHSAVERPYSLGFGLSVCHPVVRVTCRSSSDPGTRLKGSRNQPRVQSLEDANSERVPNDQCHMKLKTLDITRKLPRADSERPDNRVDLFNAEEGDRAGCSILFFSSGTILNEGRTHYSHVHVSEVRVGDPVTNSEC